MPRPSKCRRVCAMPQTEGFAPVGEAGCPQELVTLSVDEYEAIRLIDLQGMTQEQCAKQMGIARTTVTGIYDSARRKLADALVNGRRLIIGGGNYTVCSRRTGRCGMGAEKHCCRWNHPDQPNRKEGDDLT